MLALLGHSDQLVRLRENPGLIQPAVEELLRYGSPLETATERFAWEDVTIAGVTIPRGSLVYAALASANRDERQFPDPDRLDIAREPNRHLSFGLGPHFCLGAPLARLEGQVAVAAAPAGGGVPGIRAARGYSVTARAGTARGRIAPRDDHEVGLSPYPVGGEHRPTVVWGVGKIVTSLPHLAGGM